MSDPELSDFALGEAELFHGLDLRAVNEICVGLELDAGEELWRQGDRADTLCVIASGALEVSLRLPGGRRAARGTLGRGDVVGELALLDGGTRTASLTAVEPTRLLVLPYVDFRAVVRSHDAGARDLRLRLIGLAAKRLLAARRRFPEHLSTSLGSRSATAAGGSEEWPELRHGPDPSYIIKLPFFRNFSPAQLDALLGRTEIEKVPAGGGVIAEGSRPRGIHIVLNGAAEQIKRSPSGTIRAALHGPGRAFGYSILVPGGTSAGNWSARERMVMLTVPEAVLLEELAHDPFTGAVERDLVIALRQAERPQARLAAQGDDALMTPIRV